MNIRDDDQVSAVALVVESEAETAAKVAGDAPVSVADDDVVADAAAEADARRRDGRGIGRRRGCPAVDDDGAAATTLPRDDVRVAIPETGRFRRADSITS